MWNKDIYFTDIMVTDVITLENINERSAMKNKLPFKRFITTKTNV